MLQQKRELLDAMCKWYTCSSSETRGRVKTQHCVASFYGIKMLKPPLDRYKKCGSNGTKTAQMRKEMTELQAVHQAVKMAAQPLPAQ